jgi:hypothetical protein
MSSGNKYQIGGERTSLYQNFIFFLFFCDLSHKTPVIKTIRVAERVAEGLQNDD